MDSKRMIIALTCAIYIFMFGVGLITPLLPGKILSLSGSTVQVGWLASAFACSYILFQVPIGFLADKFGYKIFIAFGYFVCGAAGCIYLIADSSILILGGRVIQGIGEVPLWALAPALLSILRPAYKARIIGWYNASLHIGLTSGSIFGFAVHGYLSEYQAFVIFTSFCILAITLTLMCGNENATPSVIPETHFDIDNQKLLQLIRDRRILCVLSGIAVYGAGYGVYLTIIPSFLLKGDQFSHTSVGWLFIGFYVGISLAQLVGGYIADKKGRVLPMVTGMFLFALGQIFFPRFTIGIAIGFLSIASFGLGLFLIGSIAILNDQVGDKSKGLVSGIFYLFWGCGYFTGPLILGYAGEQGLYVQGFTSLGVLAGIISILLMALHKTMVSKDAH